MISNDRKANRSLWKYIYYRRVALRAIIKQREKAASSPGSAPGGVDEPRADGKLLNLTHNNPLPILQDNSRVGDRFMNQIEPMAAYVPYMTCPGNHEMAW